MGAANVGPRLVVCEHFAAGGALPGQDPSAMRREGEAMLLALLADLASLDLPGLAALVRPGLEAALPEGVEPLAGGEDPAEALAAVLADGGGRAWVVGPETRGTLARLTRAAERAGDGGVVGTPARGVRAAARRLAVLRRLDRAGVEVPTTVPAPTRAAARRAAARLGGDVVLKPGRGAGGAGVSRLTGPAGLAEARDAALAVEPELPPLVQPFVDGTPASATLLVRTDGILPLALSRQLLRFTPRARYRGGVTPLPHPDAARALRTARAAARACGGLLGLVGVDLVLRRDGPVVLEVNPRLTTSYLGLREHLGPDAAAAAVRAAGPPAAGAGRPLASRTPVGGDPVRFRSDGTPPAPAGARAPGSGGRRHALPGTPRPREP